jgi:[protein-PII] uridylyltransferase
LERAYTPGQHGRWSARRRSDLVDEAVRALARDLGSSVEVVALGGYGRRVLTPGSDVDLMVLHAERRPGRVRSSAERIFYPFWDASIPLGHAVRTVGECRSAARDRLDVACSLLDARLVWGDPEVFDRLQRDLRRDLRKDPGRFLDWLRDDAEERHARHPSCTHSLEPELKEGAGGLRDLQAIRWTVEVVLGDGADPVAGGLLRAGEQVALDEAEEFLVRLRSALHLATGRRADRLFLEHQPRLSKDFGFQAEPGLTQEDALMRSLFEHSRQVEAVGEAVGDRAAHRAGLAPAGHLLALPPASPEDVMVAFAGAAAAGTTLAPESLDAIDAADLRMGPFEWTETTRRAFLEILATGDGGLGVLEAMDRAGLLERFFPAWEAVRCRPQRDPYHRFTVDVHLIRTAAEAARILGGASEDDPVVAAAAAAVTDRDAVLLGALLHDIGKVGLGRHVETGSRVAAEALHRMGIPGPTRDHVLFLVEQHLLLSDTATRRDLGDENLVMDVAARVHHPERLAMLTVLTAADAEATGPHARTPWRMALIRELVGKVEHVLERGEMGPDGAIQLGERIEALRELLRGEPLGAVEAYVARLPRAYLLAVPAERVAAHYRLVAPPLAAAEVRTLAGPGERAGTYSVTVIAADRPGLLAKIAGALALAGLNILSAQAFTTEDGVAIDLFEVETAFEGEADEERWRRFRHDLRRALEGRISLEYRVREKRRHYPDRGTDVPVEVEILDDVSDFFTVVEVSAGDRIGLLFDLARTFHELELDVHLAKVATYGSRVVDAFYVRDLFGRKVDDPAHAREIERAVVARLAGEVG